MTEYIISIVAKITAAIILMILHEFPKTLIYYIKNSKSHKGLKHIFKLHHYIDPVGLLLFTTLDVGFSKPYMCSNKDRKTNIILGVTGFVILIITGVASFFGVLIYIYYSYNISLNNYFNIFIVYFLSYLYRFAINMFIVNLFPISTFDIGQMIAGISPKKYYSLVQHDTIIKGILLIVILFGLINTVVQMLF